MDAKVAVPRIGDIIRQARNKMGLSKAELARRVGVSRQTISDWEKHQSAPNRRNAPKVASVLEIPLSSISGDPTHANIAFVEPEGVQSRLVPLIDFADAGKGADVADPYPAGTGVDYLEVRLEVSSDTFALEVRGNSMQPDYNEGDIIIIDPRVDPLPEDVVVAELLPDGAEPGNGEITFKRYKPRGPETYDLVPLNPDYETVTVNKRNPGRIIGPAVEVRKRLR